jgi:hypothetical protein
MHLNGHIKSETFLYLCIFAQLKKQSCFNNKILKNRFITLVS